MYCIPNWLYYISYFNCRILNLGVVFLDWKFSTIVKMIDRLVVCDVHCQEVIMMLNQCTKDFQSLIERLQLLRAYEDADENSRYIPAHSHSAHFI